MERSQGPRRPRNAVETKTALKLKGCHSGIWARLREIARKSPPLIVTGTELEDGRQAEAVCTALRRQEIWCDH